MAEEAQKLEDARRALMAQVQRAVKKERAAQQAKKVAVESLERERRIRKLKTLAAAHRKWAYATRAQAFMRWREDTF